MLKRGRNEAPEAALYPPDQIQAAFVPESYDGLYCCRV
jgi:hypothetical protein